MQDVPKFVVKRLRETALSGGAHPDPDLLTAFAEQSLPAREREQLMEHLARCGDCRDVLALALPETEIAPLPPLKSSPAGWLRWPTLRWGAVAAGVLAVTMLGVRQYSHQNEQKMVASNQMQETVAAPVGITQAVPSQAAIPQAEKKKLASDALQPQPSTAPATAVRPMREYESKTVARNGGIGGGIASAGGNLANQGILSTQAPQNRLMAGRAQNAVRTLRQQPAVGAQSEMVEVQSATDTVTPESAPVERNTVAQNQTIISLQGRNQGDLDVVKAKEPVSGQAASAAPAPRLAPPGPLQTSPAFMVRPLPRWTVSSSGALQRSFDGGSTWEDVNPVLNAAVSGDLLKASSAKAEVGAFSPSETASTNQSRKVSAPASAALVFRAVTASGSEIWAGGSGGALYHSSDGGNSWSRVMPSTDGASLAGDVISIQFADPQHGKIITSSSEIWMTSDAGQTWRRRR
jgi:hypothetical protein